MVLLHPALAQQPASHWLHIYIYFPTANESSLCCCWPCCCCFVKWHSPWPLSLSFPHPKSFPRPLIAPRRRLQMTTQKRTPRPSRSNKLCRPLPFVHWDWQLNRVGAALISRARLPSFIVIPLSTPPPSTIHHADRCRSVSVSLPFKTLGGGWWWWW